MVTHAIFFAGKYCGGHGLGRFEFPVVFSVETSKRRNVEKSKSRNVEIRETWGLGLNFSVPVTSRATLRGVGETISICAFLLRVRALVGEGVWLAG
ncbi:hypothetical protein B7486_06545 [cyanobacterium TDX16]|nr:hypothetical protein B7486_06545 [cyanobacterium TDX16]